MSTPLRVLIVEDSPDDVRLVLRELQRAGYDPTSTVVENASDMRVALQKQNWDLIVSDYHMPNFSAPAALAVMKEFGLELPFLIVSGTVSEESAVEVMKNGAHDYLNKNNLGRLLPAVQRELREAKERQQLRQAEHSLREAEAKIRSLVEESLDGLYVIQDGRWSYVNSRLAEIFGYTQEEVINEKSVLDLVAPDSRALVTENIRKRVEGEVAELSYTLQGLQKGGEIIDIEVHGKATEYQGRPAIIGTLLDITDRKRAEALLKESEERYRELFENANDLVYTHDLTGRFTSINKAGEQLLGYTRDEVLDGMSVASIVAPDQLERARQMTARKVAGETARTTYELEIIAKDGRRIPVEVSTRLILKGGRPIGVQGICRDITERKRGEQALKDSEALYHSLVETLPMCVFRKDLEGRFIFGNQRFFDIVGKPSDQILGKTDFDFFPRELAEKYRQDDLRICESRKVFEDIEEHRPPDGRKLYVQVLKTPVYDFQGKVIGIQGMFWDITARKQAEEEVRKLTTFLDSIVENLPIVLFVKDAENLRYERFNKAGEELMKLKKEDLIGKNVYDLSGRDEADLFMKQDREVLAGKQLLDIPEERLKTWRGERIMHTRKIPLLDENGDPRHLLGISEDITERKQAEEERDRFFTVSVDMMCISGYDGYFKRLNPAWEKTLGYTSEELMAEPYLEFVHPDDRDRTVSEARKIAAGHMTVAFENRYRCKDGSYKWLLWNATPYPDQKLIYAVAHDITARKKAQEQLERHSRELEASRDRLDEFFNIATSLQDPNNVEKTCDLVLRLCQHLGYDLAMISLVDKKARVIRAVKAVGSMAELVSRTIRPLGGTDILAMVVRKGRTAIIMDSTQDFRCDQEAIKAAGVRGQIVLPLVTGEVIGTLQVASHLVLQPTPEELRALETLASQAARALAGLTQMEEIRQLNDKLGKRTKQLQQLAFDLQEIARSEKAAHEELKKAQSQLVQTEKLAALGQMVAGVAHEINNPLSFVSNNVAVLQRDVKAVRDLLRQYQEAESLPPERQRELYARIHEIAEQIDLTYTLKNLEDLMVRSRDGLKRIQQIVKDLRDFARLDESDLHEVNLNEGIESTINIIQGRAKKQGVTVETMLGTLPGVTCFPAKINQVVLNLVANAIDACSEGGKVTVRTCSNTDGVEIHVEDNGQGIDTAIHDKIFDPFFTTKPPGEGTGMGLSISYGIIQDHGGKIDFKSQIGKGTRFTVWLPLKVPELPSS